MIQKKKKTNKILIPVIIAFGFIPLVMHQVEYDDKLSQFDWFINNGGKTADFFLACKMIAIIVVGAVMLGILLYRYYCKHETMKFENGYYALFIYGMFVAMSALLSQYKHWVVFGTYQMFESVWVVLAYLVFCYYTYQYVTEESQVHSLLKWGGIGVAIMAVLGTFQYIGLDFFKSLIGRILITNPSQWESLDQITFKVSKHTVYATLYNQNFLSFYCGMLIPLILAMIIGCKKMFHRIVLTVLELLIVACMVGARSASGWIALMGSMAVTVFLLCSRRKKTFIAAGITVGAGIVALIVVCICTPIGTKLSEFLLGTPVEYAVKAIDTTGDCIEMEINDQKLKATYDYDESGNVSVVCKDGNDNVLSATRISEDSATSVIDDERYIGCTVTPTMMDNVLTLNITVDGHSWYFTKADDGGYGFVNQAGKLENYKSTKFVSAFNDNAFSLRGHIWNGALTVAKKYVFIGSGANTFLFAYPQNDYIYREYMGTQNLLDVKAHSLYLQQWIENGLIAMVAFLAFCIVYLVRCICIYRKADLHESITWIGIGLFAGVLTYLIVGIANDSNVNTAPVFWIFIGLGMAVNRIIAEKQKLFLAEVTVSGESEVISDHPSDPQKEVCAQETASVSNTDTNLPVKNNPGKKQSRKQRKNKKK